MKMKDPKKITRKDPKKITRNMLKLRINYAKYQSSNGWIFVEGDGNSKN